MEQSIEAKEKITTKDVYLRLIMLEAKMETTTTGIRGDICNLQSHFERRLWVMAILHTIQIILFVFLLTRP
jgi:hypothetical protein